MNRKVLKIILILAFVFPDGLVFARTQQFSKPSLERQSRIQGLLRQGEEAFLEGDSMKAASCFHQVLGLEKDNTSALFGLARSTLREGNKSQALQLFKRMIPLTQDADLKASAQGYINQITTNFILIAAFWVTISCLGGILLLKMTDLNRLIALIPFSYAVFRIGLLIQLLMMK